MATTLNDFVSEIQPIIRDRTNNTVETNDIRDSLNRCGRFLINNHGIYATSNREVLSIFPGVFQYALPADYHDIREIANPGDPTHFTRKDATEFWKRLDQTDNMLAIDVILGKLMLLVNRRSAGKSTLMHSMDSLGDNGTWGLVIPSDATNIATDTLVKKQGSGSIRFDVDVSLSGVDFAAIVNFDMSPLDLTSFVDRGTMFVWVFIPDATNVTSFTGQWGSSSSDFHEQIVTTNFNQQNFNDGWNRLGFAWDGSTTTGSPDDTAIDFLFLKITYDVAQVDMNDVRFDEVAMKLPEVLENHYYSKFFAQDINGNAKAAFSTGDDATLFQDQDDDIFFYYALSDAQLIKQTFEERGESQRLFEQALGMLKARYTSQRKRESRQYYKIPTIRRGTR